MPRSSIYRAVLLGLAILPGPVSSVAFAADDLKPLMPLESSASRELLTRGSDQILAGDFEAAASTLAKLRSNEPSDRTVGDLVTWVDEINKLSDSRERLRKGIFDKTVSRAQEQHKQKEWRKALGLTYGATLYTADKDAFRSLAWVKGIADEAVKHGKEFREQAKWRDAFEVYETLRLIFPDDAEYKRIARDCRQHAHFEVVYKPKGDWKTSLKNIDVSVVREILGRISQEYVREIDFKKICISGLENLVLLAKTKAIDKVFPSLGDADLVGNFIDRVEQQIGAVRRRARFDYKDAAALFDRVMKINRESLALPENVLVDEFIGGVLEPLDDFTSVIWPAEVEEFTKHTRGEFVGVGISITKDEVSQFIRVESPLEDTPAYEAGISPGDLIVAVDGKTTKDIETNDAVRIITGEPGTTVSLTIRSPNGQETTYKLTRRKVKMQTVSGYRRDDNGVWDYFIDHDRKIGYIRVSSFMEQTADDLRIALEKLQKQECKGLVLDLRFNPGGLLRSAVDVCGLFLNEDEPIVMTKGRSGKPDMEVTAKPGVGFRGMPIIILVNEYSASASEIVSGALSGMAKACIIGTRTYGKGMVQNLIPIGDNSSYLKLTTQYYYVPTGSREAPWRCLQKEDNISAWGVDPDLVVDLTPYETNKVARLRRRSDVLKGKGKAEVPKDLSRAKPTTQPSEDDIDEEALDDAPDVDPQLLTALHVMRTKLLSNQPWVHAPKLAARDPLREEKADTAR